MKLTGITHGRNVFLIFLGAFIFSVGINFFAIPSHLAEGGFTGISLLLHYAFGWSPGLIILLLNIPLLFLGYRVFGRRTFVYTLIGIGASSLMLELTTPIATAWGSPPKDILLCALYTGVLVGVGLGLIFRIGGTTGGVDIIARIVQKYLGWSIGRTMFLFDFAVIASSVFLIGLNMAMYTLVAVFISARVVDFVVEGLNASKAATIITNHPQELARTITQKMNRGVTILKGKGGYTGHEKEILYVVVGPNELPKLKDTVNHYDPFAFVVVHDAKDVLGEGFTYGK
ncbi:YitT family protein [Laceyella putida]|uniref:YitT family protein n=1 Tax=Laceyella putida TaxID=110101 RepID=A0ABW2RLZ9_9BACL